MVSYKIVNKDHTIIEGIYRVIDDGGLTKTEIRCSDKRISVYRFYKYILRGDRVILLTRSLVNRRRNYYKNNR